MKFLWNLAIATVTILSRAHAFAQDTCQDGVRVEGTVIDPSGATVAGAVVTGIGDSRSVTDASGHYVFPCQPKSFTLHVHADGFAEATAQRSVAQTTALHLDIRLAVASVSADVEVTADSPVALDADRGSGTVVLDSQMIKQLADDPDDFLRQLQALASQSGGDPTSAVITIDGFQGASVMPPKASIASIRVNPDLFSAEYRWPPYGAGLIEIVTKPGASTLHGAVFFAGSAGAWNATTAFAPTSTPASKTRSVLEAVLRLRVERIRNVSIHSRCHVRALNAGDDRRVHSVLFDSENDGPKEIGGDLFVDATGHPHAQMTQRLEPFVPIGREC